MHTQLLPIRPHTAFALVDHTFPWTPDAGDGTYRNPVLHADYSDPDVIRHGDDFWMIASSFNCTPGVPVLHSKDLVNWSLVTHVIRQLPHPRYAEVQFGCGAWAPAIRFHAGAFWTFIPLPDEGIYVARADHPAGPWSEPWLLAAAKGWIDPCPFWDDDGRAYLVHAYANSRAGLRDRLHLRPMAPDCTKLLGPGHDLVHTPHHPYLEGPKVHKLNGWYYIFAPGGGVQTGWQVVFRSRHIEGPYEEKVVLEQGETPINGPHQGALVDTPDGRWWFVHFQDAGPFGRIVHLQPVEWENDWPLIGLDHDRNGIGEPVARWQKPVGGVATAPVAVATSDEFDGVELGPQWQWQANHDPRWVSLLARPGWLRLFAASRSDLNLNRLPQFVGQKFPGRGFGIETTMDFSGSAFLACAGLAVVGGNEHAAVALRRSTTGFEVVYIRNGEAEVVSRAIDSTVTFRVDVNTHADCRFGYTLPGGSFIAIDRVFRPSAGGWMGAKVGLFHVTMTSATAAEPQPSADCDYFRFSPPKRA